MSDGSFRPIFAPSSCTDSFIDLDAAAIRALSRDPLRRIYLADLDDDDPFRVAVTIRTEFVYLDEDSHLQSELRRSGFRFAVVGPPPEPFDSEPNPYGFGVHEDANVLCHTNYRWVRQVALDEGKDMRPLHMALTRVRAVQGIQFAAFLAPYTLYYSIAKLFREDRVLIEKNITAALEEAAIDYAKSYAGE